MIVFAAGFGLASGSASSSSSSSSSLSASGLAVKVVESGDFSVGLLAVGCADEVWCLGGEEDVGEGEEDGERWDVVVAAVGE